MAAQQKGRFMKLLLSIPTESYWFQTLKNALDEIPWCPWKLHDVLAMLISTTYTREIRYVSDDRKEFINDYSKTLAIYYTNKMSDLAYGTLYPYRMRAILEAIHGGIAHFEQNHMQARELVTSGRADEFTCLGISRGAALFGILRY